MNTKRDGALAFFNPALPPSLPPSLLTYLESPCTQRASTCSPRSPPVCPEKTPPSTRQEEVEYAQGGEYQHSSSSSLPRRPRPLPPSLPRPPPLPQTGRDYDDCGPRAGSSYRTKGRNRGRKGGRKGSGDGQGGEEGEG